MRTILLLAAVTLAGCGSTASATIDSFFPGQNEVSTYVEDTTVGQPGVEVAHGATAIEALVDGDATSFNAKGVVAFAWQHYVKANLKVDARVWQMQDVANATDTYSYLVANDNLYKSNSWTDVSVGDAGRIANTGSSWWVNSRKGKYLVEVRLTGSTDTAAHDDAVVFAKAMVAKIP
jgi:hypothetical protein